MLSKKAQRRQLALSLASAWNRLESRLDGSLSATRGISFAEYRILQALVDAPGSRASRVDLARAVGLTPSGATRALRPLEKLGIVKTERAERDARLSLACMTAAGLEVVSDSTAILDDVMSGLLKGVGSKQPTMIDLVETLNMG